MYLPEPPETDAAARLRQSDLDQRGFVMNLTRLWGWRPEVCEAFVGARSALTSGSSLSKRELGVLVCATASSLGDSYCALAWGKTLADAADVDSAVAVLREQDGAALTARDQALARWARQLVRDPNATQPTDVQGLRDAGLSDREIFEATVYVAFRLAFSTINDALGVRPDWQVAQDAPAAVREAVAFGRPSMPAP